MLSFTTYGVLLGQGFGVVFAPQGTVTHQSSISIQSSGCLLS